MIDMHDFDASTSRIIPSFAGFTEFTTSIPKIYWDTKSQEQRIHGICAMLNKVICYADMLGVNVDEIKRILDDILDGKLDAMIVQAIQDWFDENEPEIMQTLDDLETAIDNATAMIGQGFGPDNTIAENVNTLNDDVDTLNDTVGGLNDDVDTLNGTVETLQQTIDDLNDKVTTLEQQNYSFEGWGGWEVLLNNNSFVAGRSFERTINNRNKYDSSPMNYYYSEYLKVMAPMPFRTLNIAGTTDRDLQTLCATNPHNNVGIDFRVITPWDAAVPRNTRVRMILTGLINTPPLNPTPEYNAVIGQQIANVALTYYDAMLNGRQFSYGRNFFYRSNPDDIINDSNGRGRMECDTFVGMALRGIPYDLSPYSVLTPDYTYEYEDLYTNVSSAPDWASSTAYSLGDIVKNGDYHYYKCIQAHTSSSTFNPSYWAHVWITNPYEIQWATSMNSAMHPANPYLGRDVLFAGDYAFLGWEQSRVFRNAEQALTGDVAIWVRRAKTPTYWGGTAQSTAFDNVAHVGIIYIENGQKYVLHVTGSQVFERTVVNKTPIEEFGVEPPSYFYRPLYS